MTRLPHDTHTRTVPSMPIGPPKLGQHAFLLTVGTGSTAVLSLVYSVYAGRMLGPAANADFVAALFIALIFNIALGPINGTVTRFAARYAGANEHGQIRSLHRWFWRRVLAGEALALAVGVITVTWLASALRFESVRPLLAAYAVICLTLLVSTGRGVLRGVQHFGAYSANIVSESAVRLGCGIPLVALAPTAAMGLSAYIIGLLFVLALLTAQLRTAWADHPPTPVDDSEIRRFVLPMFVLMATSAGLEYADLLFAKRVFTPDEAGVYGAACVLTRAISVVATPFYVLMLPALTHLYAQGRPLAGTFVRVCVYFLLLAIVPLGLFLLCPDPIMQVTYGEEFAAAAPLLLPLAAARVLCYLGAMIAQLFASTGRFLFLGVYVPALGLELVVLGLWHASLSQLVHGVIVSQAVTLLILGTVLTLDSANRRRRAPKR